MTGVVLDATDLTYISSRGLRALVQATRALAGKSGRFLICPPTEHVRSPLEVDQLLEPHDTRAAAMSALGQSADTHD